MKGHSLAWIRDWGPRCCSCHQPSWTWLCQPCHEKLSLRGTCTLCLHDFHRHDGQGHETVANLCARCRTHGKPYENLWISYRYEGAVSTFIIDMKNRYPEKIRELSCHGVISEMGHRRYGGIVSPASHPNRVRIAGFDSGRVLASFLAKKMGAVFWEKAFIRLPFLASQKEMSASERQRFLGLQVRLNESALPPRAPRSTSPRVLLVDDIMTTGATIDLHAGLLRAQGYLVDVYCLSRALKKSKVA